MSDSQRSSIGGNGTMLTANPDGPSVSDDSIVTEHNLPIDPSSEIGSTARETEAMSSSALSGRMAEGKGMPNRDGTVPRAKWNVKRLSKCGEWSEEEEWTAHNLAKEVKREAFWFSDRVRAAKKKNCRWIELKFHTPNNEEDVVIIAKRDLGISLATKCFSRLFPIGGPPKRLSKSKRGSKGESKPTESHDRRSEAPSSPLSNMVSLPQPSSRTISTVAASQLPASAYSDVLKAVEHTERTSNGAGSEDHLWPDLYMIERWPFDPTKNTVPRGKELEAHIGYDAMWNGLSDPEQNALMNSERDDLPGLLISGAKTYKWKAMGATVRVSNVTCVEYVKAGQEHRWTPERIVGELKRIVDNRHNGPGSWICYKYALIKESEQPLWSGFATDTRRIQDETDIPEEKIRIRLPQDGMQANFTNAEQDKWCIRRVGWDDNGKPWEEGESYEIV